MNHEARSDAARGAVMGALVGDAAGAVLEFLGRPVTPADVTHALTMPGGGTWQVARGQITDDGELTMCLLLTLAKPGASPRDAAVTYTEWVASDPFDIGATTAAAMGCLRDAAARVRAREVGVDVVMAEAAAARCMGSKANGSLMRATPLGVWGAVRDDEALVRATLADARLSHPNPACTDAAVAYTLAIASLIRTPGDARAAVALARAWVGANACDEVKGWLADAEAGVRVPFSPQDGFVKIAFTHAFRHLVLGTSYADAIAETLAGGGDTDTNACIVGGLVGALGGANAIPAPLRAAVLGADTREGTCPRPAWLHPHVVPACVDAILHAGG